MSYDTSPAPPSTAAFAPTREELMAIFDMKYRRFGALDWGPRQRLEFGYFSPDDYYEAVVAKLVTNGCSWADIGCGRDLFPSNPVLAEVLSKRCGFLLGIDPDPNLRDNRFISEGFQGVVEDCDTTRTFDVLTMRMVAEHIVDPDRAVAKIAALLKPSGFAVVYTPNKWSPMSLIATAVPFRLHNPLKRLIWDTESRDTFPTAYKLNTRSDLSGHFARNSMREAYFTHLDDCRIFTRYRLLNRAELSVRRAFNFFGLNHPENCLLGVYQRSA